jgi:Mg/Co/Ni transporter MgtE
MKMMKDMMQKMMSGMIKPEDMPEMMGAMMENMFSKMTTEDRMKFVSTMTPNCLNMIFAELDESSKQKLAKEMLNKMTDIFASKVTKK